MWFCFVLLGHLQHSFYGQGKVGQKSNGINTTSACFGLPAAGKVVYKSFRKEWLLLCIVVIVCSPLGQAGHSLFSSSCYCTHSPAMQAHLTHFSRPGLLTAWTGTLASTLSCLLIPASRGTRFVKLQAASLPTILLQTITLPLVRLQPTANQIHP